MNKELFKDIRLLKTLTEFYKDYQFPDYDNATIGRRQLQAIEHLIYAYETIDKEYIEKKKVVELIKDYTTPEEQEYRKILYENIPTFFELLEDLCLHG